MICLVELNKRCTFAGAFVGGGGNCMKIQYVRNPYVQVIVPYDNAQICRLSGICLVDYSFVVLRHLAGGTPTSPMAAPLEKMGSGECVENRD